MSTARLPIRAHLEEAFDAIALCGPFAGKRVRILRHSIPQGYADAGKEFVSVHVDEAGFHRRWQYSGKQTRIAQAFIQDFKDGNVDAGRS